MLPGRIGRLVSVLYVGVRLVPDAQIMNFPRDYAERYDWLVQPARYSDGFTVPSRFFLINLRSAERSSKRMLPSQPDTGGLGLMIDFDFHFGTLLLLQYFPIWSGFIRRSWDHLHSVP